jgi:hypothetical protein
MSVLREERGVDAGGAIGAYYHCERTWTCIAASKIDEDGTEVADPTEVGKVSREREWRFADREYAEMWAEVLAAEEEIEAPEPHRIADAQHRRNGWVVRVEQEASR